MTKSSSTRFVDLAPAPELRFGVGLRRPHFDDLLEAWPGVDFLEMISENYMDFGGRPRDVILKARERFPLVLHGVSLSIGGLDPLNERYLKKLRDLADLVDPPWFSDHLSYSSHWGVEYHDLLPLPFTEEAVEHVVARVRRVQDAVGRPFLLENPSYYVELPGKEMTEAEFLKEVLERSDCGLLLDINNVFVNAKNHGYDPYAFLDEMPRERIRQYHMAGHDDRGPFLVDTHGSHIQDEVFEMYKYALTHLGPAWTLLEWDNAIPAIDVLLRENDYIRKAAAEALGDPSIHKRVEVAS